MDLGLTHSSAKYGGCLINMQAAPAGSGRSRLPLNACAAVFATAAQTLIGMLLYAYLIRRVGAATVGVWVSLMAAGLLACTADLGLNYALVRRLALTQHDTEGPSAHETVETLVWSVALLAGAALVATDLAFPLWSVWLNFRPEVHADAARWLPLVLIGLWLNRIADALGSCLDGQQRFVERSIAGTCALLAGLVLSLVCVPLWAMDGLAAAFVIQNALLAGANFVLLTAGLPGLRWLRPRLRLDVLRDGARYGLSVQALVLCYLVLESGIKLTLARGGNLTAVSYFDLSFRIAKGIRGLLASALRVLVPRLAPTGWLIEDSALRWSLYARSFGALLVIALPIFAGLLAASHGIAWLMVGRNDPVFVEALMFALLPWLAYSLTDPALNLSMASGRMGWPLGAHLVTLALSAVLVFSWGSPTSSRGLYAIVMFAMLVGCVITFVGVHRNEHLPWRLLQPGMTLIVLLVGVLTGLLGVFAPALLPWQPPILRWCAVAAGYLGFLSILCRHPAARSLLGLGQAASQTPQTALQNYQPTRRRGP